MPSLPQQETVLTDPYLDPSNVYPRDGVLVAKGPHGEEFTLTEGQRSVISGIADGTLPSYKQQITQLIQASMAQEVPHP